MKVADSINNRMPAYVAERVQQGLNERKKPVNGSRILVLGLAYKKNSNDARETPATGVIKNLLAMGAEIHAHDPLVGSYELDDQIERVELTEAKVAAADAIVLLTDHDSVDYDLVSNAGCYVLNARKSEAADGFESL